MGSYLSEPMCEKISENEANDLLRCGASSMQGWRLTQEDAHNCILNYDTDTSYFAVYDGHGGHEVAAYCSQKLPDFIKNLDSYKNKDLKKALEEGFLGFDATIATPEIIAILKEILKDTSDKGSDEDEENVDNLYEEANMPLNEVIKKYGTLAGNLANRALTSLQGDKVPVSPLLKAKRGDEAISSSSSVATTSSKTTDNSCKPDSSCSNTENEVVSTVPDEKVVEKTEEKETVKVEKESVELPDSSVDIKEDKPYQNGDVPDKNEVVSSSSAGEALVENGIKKGKGKATAKTKGVKAQTQSRLRPKRTVKEMYAKLLDYEENSEEESEDEDDKTFESPNDDTSDEEGVNAVLESDSSEGEAANDEEEVEEEEEDEDGMDEENLAFARNMREEPGSDSGCTAVVALLRGNDLYVANAGDSRCVVCRNGKAVEMSFDHKPEDEPERLRVVKAGGKVTSDGRVNGGLNLSRAIGDHAYKQNKELNDKEQMITAFPDVKMLTIEPGEDEFMVLACDGIWNFMSSQDVVEYVRPLINEGFELAKICEKLFDHCLAPNTGGDGTGCDNMTAIIVQFKPSLKRPSSPNKEESDTKRTKTEEAVKEEVTA